MDLAKIRKKLNEAKKKEIGAADEKETKNVIPPEPEEVKSVKASRPRIERAEETPPGIINEENSPPELPEEEVSIIGEAPEEGPLPEAPAILDEPEGGPPETAPEGGEALEKDKPPEEENIVEFLHFRLANEDYAFKVSEIEEILKFHNVTPVPRMKPYVMGLSSLRGKIIPLVDLKKRLGLSEDMKERAKPRIVILNGPKGSVGAWVDLVIDVLRIPEDMIQDPPAHLSEGEARFIEGIALWEGKFVSIIRTDEALNILVED